MHAASQKNQIQSKTQAVTEEQGDKKKHSPRRLKQNHVHNVFHKSPFATEKKPYIHRCLRKAEKL